MKKWGTKSEIAGAIIFTLIFVDFFFSLNKYLLLVGAISSLLLILSSVYDWYKGKKRNG